MPTDKCFKASSFPWYVFLFQLFQSANTEFPFNKDTSKLNPNKAGLFVGIFFGWYVLIQYSSEPQKNWSWSTCFSTVTLATSIEESFFAILIARRLPRFIDTIPFSLASIKPTFMTTSAREFGAFMLLLHDLLACCKNFGT